MQQQQYQGLVAPITQLPQDIQTTGTNTNEWKPRLNTKAGIVSYSARTRLLPEGLDGLKNNTQPIVKSFMHYLQDKETGVYRKVKCRHSLSGDKFSKNERCPVCDNLWTRWKAFNKIGNAAGKTYIQKMLAIEEWHGNVLIREDDNNNENNNTVKIMEMTTHLRNLIWDPTVPQKKLPNNAPNREKPKRMFYPHCPYNGVDFQVILSVDNSKQITDKKASNTYDASYYLDNPSPLANTEEEMVDILSQCHDLSEYYRIVPTEEEAEQVCNSFWTEVSEKQTKQQMAGSVPNYIQNNQHQATALPKVNMINTQQFTNGLNSAQIYQPNTTQEDLGNIGQLGVGSLNTSLLQSNAARNAMQQPVQPAYQAQPVMQPVEFQKQQTGRIAPNANQLAMQPMQPIQQMQQQNPQFTPPMQQPPVYQQQAPQQSPVGIQYQQNINNVPTLPPDDNGDDDLPF
jgi:hypothetical protein